MPKGKEYKYFDFPVANSKDRKQGGGKISGRLMDLYRERKIAEDVAPGSKRRKSIQNVIDVEEGTYKKTSPKYIAKAKAERKKFRGKSKPTK